MEMETLAGYVEDHTANPMQMVMSNPLLVSKILENFTVASDLKNLRLVSTQWCEICRPQWRRSVTVSLVKSVPPPSIADQFLVFIHINRIAPQKTTIHEFVMSVKDRDQYARMPFLHFHLEKIGCSEIAGFNQFWDLCSPFMRSLTLTKSCFETDESFLRTLAQHRQLQKLVLIDPVVHKPGDLPSQNGNPLQVPVWPLNPPINDLEFLETLEIKIRDVKLARPLVWFRKLLRFSPNLKTLITRDVSLHYVEDILEQFVVNRVLVGRHILNLKHLHILQSKESQIDIFYPADFLCAFFRALAFPLESISIQFSLPQNSVQTIKQIHRGTLKRSELYGVPTTDDDFFAGDNDEEMNADFRGALQWIVRATVEAYRFTDVSISTFLVSLFLYLAMRLLYNLLMADLI